MPSFFIDRPIFAWVIAILILLGGAIAITTLGIESYPSIAPPQVVVSANYPGADAETVEKTVTQVIEQQLTGIDHLMYFSSTSSVEWRLFGNVDVRSGNEPRHRPGTDAKQGRAGDAGAPAERSDPARRDYGQVESGLPDVLQR